MVEIWLFYDVCYKVTIHIKRLYKLKNIYNIFVILSHHVIFFRILASIFNEWIIKCAWLYCLQLIKYPICSFVSYGWELYTVLLSWALFFFPHHILYNIGSVIYIGEYVFSSLQLTHIIASNFAECFRPCCERSSCSSCC